MIPLYDRNPTRTVPFVTLVLIAANVAVFLYEVNLMMRSEGTLREFIDQMAMFPAKLSSEHSAHAVRSIFTSMFLHGGVLHVVGNMLYLWVFGNNVEDAMGHFRFALFYLLSGVAAAIAQVMVSPDSMVPTLGASGAIAGVLGGYLLLHPRARVVTWIPIFWLFLTTVEVPAYFFLVLWFFMQIINGLPALEFHAAKGGVAWWAHIGGFAAGFVLTPIFKRRDVRLF